MCIAGAYIQIKCLFVVLSFFIVCYFFIDRFMGFLYIGTIINMEVVMNDNCLLLSVSQVADKLGVSKGTIYQYVHYRKIPFVKVNGKLRFIADEITKWVMSGKVEVVDCNNRED